MRSLYSQQIRYEYVLVLGLLVLLIEKSLSKHLPHAFKVTEKCMVLWWLCHD